MESLIGSARLVLVVILLTAASPWSVNWSGSKASVTALDVSTETILSGGSDDVTTSNFKTGKHRNLVQELYRNAPKSDKPETIKGKNERHKRVDITYTPSSSLKGTPDKDIFDNIKDKRRNTEEKRTGKTMREIWRPHRKITKEKKRRARKLSRLARARSDDPGSKRADDALEHRSKFRNGGSPRSRFSSSQNDMPSSSGVTDDSSVLYDTVTGSQLGYVDFTQASSLDNEDEISDDETLTDSSSGFGKGYGGGGPRTSSGIEHDPSATRKSSEHDIDHEHLEDLHHPLGADYARIHQSILNGIVPQEDHASGGFDPGYPSGAAVAAHPAWLLEDLGPHDLPDPNTHSLDPNSLGHDLHRGGQGHPLSSDLPHAMGVPGGLGHPFSADLSHGMGGGHHMPSDDIVFDFGAFDLDGHNDDTRECFEKCRCHGFTVSCFWCNLSQVPSGINPSTKTLVLIRNNLSHLPADAFHNLTRLETLTFSGNDLKKLPGKIFRDNRFLQKLYLQGNQFRRVPAKAFNDLTYLLELNLDDNRIESVPDGAFQGLYNLQGLWLAKNFLTEVPAKAFSELPGLMSLRLTKNAIKRIRRHDFIHHPKLLDISLAINEIEVIEDGAFEGLGKLKFLDLHMNRLQVMPGAFSQLSSLVQLNLQSNELSYIPDGSFVSKQLQFLELENNPIRGIGNSAFVNLPSLQKLELAEAYDIVRFPNLTGTTNLTLLRLDRANVKAIPSNICQQLTKLEQLDVHTNKLRVLPPLTECRSLRVLNLANNELTSIDGQLFKGLHSLQDLTISNNFIMTIAEDTFVGLPNLEYLNLVHNQIKRVHPDAFRPLKRLKNLNLANNNLNQLPTAGLDSLETLKIFNNMGLREFPPKEEFPSIKSFYLTYAYHCCDYINTVSESEVEKSVKEYHNFNDDIPLHVWDNHVNYSHMVKDNISLDFDHVGGQQLPFLQQHQELPQLSDQDAFLESSTGEFYHSHPYTLESPEVAIACLPKPGPFMPCDDLFGFWTLRCGVWVVFMLALLGNGVVFFVSVTSKSKMDVTRFLICNLAAADFFMGVYLGMLAIIDASTLGQFKRYAIQWQLSAGCSIAGFLGVLSSELSVFTLTVITLERFYAITNAIQLNKRLSLKHASLIMLGGWIWSFTLALLPIFGISDYRKFAVCLPFKIEDIISKTYVCFIMAFNGVSFFVILSCYVIMYISIRHSGAWNSNDTRVAKRMALLVITDLACWAPIAFLSLCAAFGKNLISLTEAKVLTIFVLPLNSCANPFLYAIFTKQFKRDCVLLCRRLEDSSIARHFSQVSPGHLSMSWKCQRRASGLRILVGEGKSGTSNNSASQSCGLVNNNSDVNTSTNKEKDYDIQVCKENKYLHLPLPSSSHHHQHHHHHCSNGRHSPNSISNGGTTLTTTDNSCSNYTHKYKPCPTSPESDDIVDCGAEDWGMNGVPQDGAGCKNGGKGSCLYKAVRYHPAKNTCRGVKDAQVILHQGYCYQNGTDTGNATTETYFSNDDFEYDDETDDCKVKDTRQQSNTYSPLSTDTAARQGCGIGGGAKSSGKPQTAHCLITPKNCKKKSSLKRQKQEISAQQKSYQRPLEDTPAQGLNQQIQEPQSVGQDHNHQRKRMRPPSITLDSGEAGESIEMIFCPSGEFCELPFPEANRATSNGSQKVDLDVSQDDDEDDGSCVWVKRSSPLPSRNQRPNGCLESKETAAHTAGDVHIQEVMRGLKTGGANYKGPSDMTLNGNIIDDIMNQMPGAYFKQDLNYLPNSHTAGFNDINSDKDKDVFQFEGERNDTVNIPVFNAAVGVIDKGIGGKEICNVPVNNETARSFEGLLDTYCSKEKNGLNPNGTIEGRQELQNSIPTSLPAQLLTKEQSPKTGKEETEVTDTIDHQDVHLKPEEGRKRRRDHHSKGKSKHDKHSSRHRHRHRHSSPGKASKPKAVPIDKSVHLRFFQESMAASAEARGDPHHVIHRSNSLVQLTEPQLQKALIGVEEDDHHHGIHDRDAINFPLETNGEAGSDGFYGRNPRQSRLRRSLTSKQEESLSSRRGADNDALEGYLNWKNYVQFRDGEGEHNGQVYHGESEYSQMFGHTGSTDLDNDDSNSNTSCRDNPPYPRQYSNGNCRTSDTNPFISHKTFGNTPNARHAAELDLNGKLVNEERKACAKQNNSRHLEFADEDDEGEESPSSATNGILGWEDPGMTGMNDSDDLRDSLSSARNSADKESGFHSQN